MTRKLAQEICQKKIYFMGYGIRGYMRDMREIRFRPDNINIVEARTKELEKEKERKKERKKRFCHHFRRS